MALSNYHHAAEIKDGKLVLSRTAAFRTAMWRMKPGRVVVKVERVQSKRTNALNRFYWGWPIELTAEHCGYTKDEMHDAWKWRFLRLEDPDHKMPTVRSTADLSDAEMFKYIEDIRIAAATELGVLIPEFNEHLEAAS